MRAHDLSHHRFHYIRIVLKSNSIRSKSKQELVDLLGWPGRPGRWSRSLSDGVRTQGRQLRAGAQKAQGADSRDLVAGSEVEARQAPRTG